MQVDRENLSDLEEENERLRQEVASLDELPREQRPGTVSDLKGPGDIPTSVGKGIRSIPGGQDRYYLDLYLLQKERDRLARETSWIKRRRLRVGQRFSDVGRETADKEAKAMEGMSTLTGEPARDTGKRPKAPSKSKPKKYQYKEEEWQRMSIDY